MPHEAGPWRRAVDLRHRRWFQVATVTLALLALAAIGASGVLLRAPTPVQLARADAVAQAKADHAALFAGPWRAWTAEELGRRASLLRGTQLLSVTGDSPAWADGVQLVIRVVGHSRADPSVAVPVCFNLRFGRYFHNGVRTVACPDAQPLRYPPPRPPPVLPTGSRLRAAVIVAVQDIGRHAVLAGTTREAALGAAVAALGLDPRIEFGIGRASDVAGLALDAYDPVRLGYTCVLLRLSPHGIDVWHLPPPAPGVNPRCTGYAAAIGLGFQKPPTPAL